MMMVLLRPRESNRMAWFSWPRVLCYAKPGYEERMLLVPAVLCPVVACVTPV